LHPDSFSFRAATNNGILNYLVDCNWPEQITEIIGNINRRRLAEIQNMTGSPLPKNKFTLEDAIHALQNVKNETISERKQCV
jgi:hypothetical protein